jgi:hypothetical protein
MYECPLFGDSYVMSDCRPGEGAVKPTGVCSFQAEGGVQTEDLNKHVDVRERMMWGPAG